MVYKIYLSLVLLMVVTSQAFGQAQVGEIQGRVTDENGEPLSYATVEALRNDVQRGAAVTDEDGRYVIKPLNPGNYDLKIKYFGKQTRLITDIKVQPDRVVRKNVILRDSDYETDEVVVETYKKPIIEADQASVGGTMTEDEVKKAPTRSVNRLVGLTAGVQSDEGGAPSIKGSRPDATIYFVDGVRVRGLQGVPQNSIEQLTVLTGGIPAEYGDATGGVISIITKGPSSEFTGGGEFISSQLTDPYGYNLFEGSLSGPLYTKYKGTDSAKTTLGFFLSGNISHVQDGSPSATDIWRPTDETKRFLQEQPLSRSPLGRGEGFVPTAEFITKDDLETVAVRQNVASFNATLNAKIDWQPTDLINITVGGQYQYNRGNVYSLTNSLFNYDNNREDTRTTLRAYARFTQRFKDDKKTTEGEKKNLRFSNMFYVLQFDFTRQTIQQQDATHRDNIFDYGHYGQFDVYNEPIYQNDTVRVNGRLQETNVLRGFRDTMVDFRQAEINRVAGNYTQQFFNLRRSTIQNLDEIRENGALINGITPNNIYSLWTGVGQPNPGYAFLSENQFTFNGTFSVNINENHAIKAGFQYEQRDERLYSVNALNIWNAMRLDMNSHISQLDTDNPIPVFDENGVFMDTVNYRYLDDGRQTRFDRTFRNQLIERGATDVYGRPINQQSQVNIDRYSPDNFSMDMFDPDNLAQFGSGILNYRGFDHTGSLLSSRPTIDDFLNNPDQRLIPSYNPIYIAGFIQDQFTFRDIIFRVGLRVDRFDANQQVLSDPFSFFPTRSVGEVSEVNGIPVSHPGNMRDDYVVYVDNASNPGSVTGYRSGMNWFDASGNEVADPAIIANQSATGQIEPYLAQGEEFTREAFTDYDAQLNIMPRVAFSFPISEEANFFANYDVLTQRPRGNNIATIADYYYFETRSTTTLANPNLQPEIRTNYELGFKQLLTPNSGLTITAFYSEIRNMVQLVRMNGAFPRTYDTYENIDFGTVKGLTMSYDLRPTSTSNFRLMLNYTLQFADGTGSNAVDARALLNAGQPNLRTPFPLDNDIRHNIQANFDYRFGGGSRYNGPMIGSFKVLENTGANFIISSRSGRPFSGQGNVTQDVSIGVAERGTLDGLVNGSRMPWWFTADFRIDRDFELKLNKPTEDEIAEGVKQKRMTLNFYIWIQNMFNTANIRNVYRYTGAPDDDGFLASQRGQTQIAEQVVQQAYMDQYSIKLANPGRFSLPRTIRLGLIFNF